MLDLTHPTIYALFARFWLLHLWSGECSAPLCARTPAEPARGRYGRTAFPGALHVFGFGPRNAELGRGRRRRRHCWLPVAPNMVAGFEFYFYF